MELTTIRELFKDRESYLGKKVTIGGWVRSLRDSKTFGFIVVNDGSYFEPLQIVYHDEMENFAEVSKLNVGAAIIVKGTLVATPQAKQPFEIQADEVQIEGASASDYPQRVCASARHNSGFPDPAEAPFDGIPQGDWLSASENEYISGCIPCAFSGSVCDS